MSAGNVSGTGTLGSSSSTTPRKTGTMGLDAAEQKEMFLQLLVAQLKNQDPTSPMDQKEMLGQMAQMSSLEQMVNMTSSVEALKSTSYIGRSVQYRSSADSTLISDPAKVTGTSTLSGKLKLVLESGLEVDPDQVVTVSS